MKILLFLSLLIYISCKSESATVEHIGSRFVLSFEKIKLKIFIATDEGGQGF
jgi:hypothetical protein